MSRLFAFLQSLIVVFKSLIFNISSLLGFLLPMHAKRLEKSV